MKRLSFIFTACFLVSLTSAIASSPDLDRESIKKMQGCYLVDFNFIETLALSEGYEVKKSPYHEKAYEWIALDVDQPTKVVLQHILVTPHMLIKHWRQDWTYEDTQLLSFRGDFKWQSHKLDVPAVKGHWTQAVYQVDDSPRYECSAPWIHLGDHHYWECQAWAPLPRREEKRAHEYNVLDRRNRHEILPTGWLHAQTNDKIIVRDGVEQSKLAQESGRDLYTKVDDSHCAKAKEWWHDNRQSWVAVRSVWDEIYSEHNALEFRQSVEGKKLYEEMFDIANDIGPLDAAGMSGLKARTRDVINKYRVSDKKKGRDEL
jgi:hypothetical protein